MARAVKALERFQLPPPRGGRRDSLLPADGRTYFNSRPRAGGDLAAPSPLP